MEHLYGLVATTRHTGRMRRERRELRILMFWRRYCRRFKSSGILRCVDYWMVTGITISSWTAWPWRWRHYDPSKRRCYHSTRHFIPEDLNRGLKNFLVQMLVQFRTHRRPCAVYYLFVLQHYKMNITRIYQHTPDLLRRGEILCWVRETKIARGIEGRVKACGRQVIEANRKHVGGSMPACSSYCVLRVGCTVYVLERNGGWGGS